MKRGAAVLLAALALGACSRSEAQEAADASERWSEPAGEVMADGESLDAYEALLGDEDLVQEAMRQMGGPGDGELTPCERPARRPPVPPGWKQASLPPGMMARVPTTVYLPPGWSEQSEEGVWLAVNQSQNRILSSPAFPSVVAGTDRLRDLGFAAIGAGFEEVYSAERLDEETCLFTGLMQGLETAIVSYQSLDGTLGAVFGMAGPGAPRGAAAEMADVLRLVRFG